MNSRAKRAKQHEGQTLASQTQPLSLSASVVLIGRLRVITSQAPVVSETDKGNKRQGTQTHSSEMECSNAQLGSLSRIDELPLEKGEICSLWYLPVSRASARCQPSSATVRNGASQTTTAITMCPFVSYCLHCFATLQILLPCVAPRAEAVWRRETQRNVVAGLTLFFHLALLEQFGTAFSSSLFLLSFLLFFSPLSPLPFPRVSLISSTSQAGHVSKFAMANAPSFRLYAMDPQEGDGDLLASKRHNSLCFSPILFSSCRLCLCLSYLHHLAIYCSLVIFFNFSLPAAVSAWLHLWVSPLLVSCCLSILFSSVAALPSVARTSFFLTRPLLDMSLVRRASA